MRDQDKAVYMELYKIAAEKRKEHGQDMFYTPGEYMMVNESEENLTDILKLDELRNEEALTTVYPTILKRIPDEDGSASWKEHLDEKERFKGDLVHGMIWSEEFTLRKTAIFNNVTKYTEPEPETPPEPKPGLMKKVYRKLKGNG